MTLPVIMLTALSASQTRSRGWRRARTITSSSRSRRWSCNARLTAILRGRGWTTSSGDTLQAGDIVVSPTTFRAWRGGRPIDLAKLELKLLVELVRNVDAVLTRAMLIERVWGYDFIPDTNIVDVHIRRLRRKLTEARRRRSDPDAARHRLHDARMKPSLRALTVGFLTAFLVATAGTGLAIYRRRWARSIGWSTGGSRTSARWSPPTAAAPRHRCARRGSPRSHGDAIPATSASSSPTPTAGGSAATSRSARRCAPGYADVRRRDRIQGLSAGRALIRAGRRRA